MQQLQAQIRTQPGDARLRTFLFQLLAVRGLLGDLDIRTPQVSIQAKIIFVNRTDLDELGVTYELKDSRGNQINQLSDGAADLNGDGVLDLAVANSGQPSRMYLNVGINLAPSTGWNPTETDRINSVAWGDFDRDGDLDVSLTDGYGAEGDWTFEDPFQSEVSGIVLTFVTTTVQAFSLGLYFFISGYFTPRSYDRKGAGQFWKDRLLRLALGPRLRED